MPEPKPPDEKTLAELLDFMLLDDGDTDPDRVRILGELRKYVAELREKARHWDSLCSQTGGRIVDAVARTEADRADAEKWRAANRKLEQQIAENRKALRLLNESQRKDADHAEVPQESGD